MRKNGDQVGKQHLPLVLKRWARWLERMGEPHPHDPQYLALSEGIASFRHQLALREPKMRMYP